GSYDLTPRVRLRASMLFSDREARRQVAGYPFQSADFGIAMSEDSYYYPVGSHHGHADSQAVTFWRRTWEVPREERPTSTTWRFSAALEGSFEAASRVFDWEVGYLYNRNKVTQENYGNLNLSRVAEAVGPSFLNADGVVQC